MSTRPRYRPWFRDAKAEANDDQFRTELALAKAAAEASGPGSDAARNVMLAAVEARWREQLAHRFYDHARRHFLGT